MKALVLVLLVAACGFPRPAGYSPDANATPDTAVCAECQLVSIEPSIANAGDTITLEGTFGDAATVNFPGGVSAAATILGPHRATAIVPPAAIAGDLTVTVADVTFGALPFRRASFALGLQRFDALDDQASITRQPTVLNTPRANHTSVVVGSSLYVIGGVGSGGAPLGTVERATINADGSLGSFSLVTGVTLATARFSSRAVAIGGFVYVIGGATDSAYTATDTVERAAIMADGSIGPFTSVAGVKLATARSGHTLELIGNALYVIGGAGSSSFAPMVERATIAPDGTLGSFVATASLAVPRSLHASAVIGSYVYAFGGDDSYNTTSTTVERAPINPDGSLGAFAIDTATTLTTARDRVSAVVVGASVCLVGGFNPNAIQLSSVECATITEGSLGAFAPAPNALPARRASYTTATLGNVVYLVGGSDSTQAATATVFHASLDASGALGTYAPISATLATGRSGTTRALIGSSLYLVGGADASGNLLTSVERATVASDGSVGAFATVPSTSLLVARQRAASAVVGSSLYVLGGLDATGHAITSIERATIAVDGSLGPFVAAGTLATTRAQATSVVAGGFLYVIGGGDACCGLFLNTVERATIAADGSLGAFANLTGTMTAPHAGPTTAVIGGFLYVFGGSSSPGVYSSTVERAAINSDGSLGTFAVSSGGSLVSARQGHTSAVIGSFIYVIGGINSTGRLDTVERAAIAADGTLAAFANVATSKLATARANAANAVIGNTCYAFGGDTAATSNTVESALLP